PCALCAKERCYTMLRSKAANGSWKRTEILGGLALDALWQIPQQTDHERGDDGARMAEAAA
ncbi:MAG: hypothetical protein WBF49_14495, partial [Methyloceanibacter sp.]